MGIDPNTQQRLLQQQMHEQQQQLTTQKVATQVKSAEVDDKTPAKGVDTQQTSEQKPASGAYTEARIPQPSSPKEGAPIPDFKNLASNMLSQANLPDDTTKAANALNTAFQNLPTGVSKDQVMSFLMNPQAKEPPTAEIKQAADKFLQTAANSLTSEGMSEDQATNLVNSAVKTKQQSNDFSTQSKFNSDTNNFIKTNVPKDSQDKFQFLNASPEYKSAVLLTSDESKLYEQMSSLKGGLEQDAAAKGKFVETNPTDAQAKFIANVNQNYSDKLTAQLNDGNINQDQFEQLLELPNDPSAADKLGPNMSKIGAQVLGESYQESGKKLGMSDKFRTELTTVYPKALQFVDAFKSNLPPGLTDKQIESFNSLIYHFINVHILSPFYNLGHRPW